MFIDYKIYYFNKYSSIRLCFDYPYRGSYQINKYFFFQISLFFYSKVFNENVFTSLFIGV